MVVDDRFVASPSMQVQSLSPEVLRHWGLIASPFANDAMLEHPLDPNEFYFRTAAHASAWAWLQNLVRRPSSLAVVNASSHAGVTTWIRQLRATSGIGDTALEIAAVSWKNQSLEQLTAPLLRTACQAETPSNVRTLWMIDATDGAERSVASTPRRLSLMSGWWAARETALRNLNIVLVVRKSGGDLPNGSVTKRIATYSLKRSGSHEMRRCVNAALHHAGAVRPLFTVSAISHLADHCRGSVRRLAALVHTSLLHGQLAGVRQVTHADLTKTLWRRDFDEFQGPSVRAA